MSSIGELLRRERLRRNLDLDQISRELKIAPRFLEAIEDDRFDRLPGGVFAKSFVRQYARLLDLDEDELASEVHRIFEPEPAEAGAPVAPLVPDIRLPKVEQWDAVGDRRPFDWSSGLPALALVVVVMLVCSGVYAFWQRARRPVITAQTSPPSVESVQPEAKPEQPPQAAPAQPTAESPAAVTPPAPAPQVPAEPGATERPPAQAPPAAEVGAGEAARAAGSAVRVQVTAEEPVWVLARTDGKYAFSGTLEANETRLVEASGKVVLRLGNAGGVTVTLNGKNIGTVGPKGQVREIQLTSGGFQIVAAPKPSLPLDNPI